MKFSILVDRTEHRVTVEVPQDFIESHTSEEIVALLDRTAGGLVVVAQVVDDTARTDLHASAHIS